MLWNKDVQCEQNSQSWSETATLSACLFNSTRHSSTVEGLKKTPTSERFWQVDLDRGPDFLLIGRGPIADSFADWVQPIDRWTMLMYHEPTVVHLNVHSFEAAAGTVVLFAPGSVGHHHRVSENATGHFATFRLPGRNGVRRAVPVTWSPSQEMQEAFDTAAKSVAQAPERGFSFVWYQLWHVARPLSVFRRHSELYGAEEWIMKNLGQRFRVEDIANAVELSPRTLLRIFQLEHGITVTQFVRNRRVQEATRLLTETNLSLKAIAARVGITDSHQFNKLVRYATGLSPSTYRRNES